MTLAVFFSLFFATWISEDFSCITAGLLVSQELIPFLPAVSACFLGIYTGDGVVFLAGRYGGRALLPRRWMRRFIPLSAEVQAERLFQRRGPWLILATRFLPGSRLPTYFAAGVLRTRPISFFLFFALAGILWTPLLVGLAAIVGERVIPLLETYSRWALAVTLAASISLFILMRSVVHLSTWRGRRLLLSRWRRCIHWEYWPIPVLYFPVFLYYLRLAWRYRSITLPTLANPGMPLGGLAGESKSEILQKLHQGSPGLVPAFIRLEPGTPAAQRLSEIESFQSGLAQPWPIVLKPDIGERGRGVTITRHRDDLHFRLQSQSGVLLAQEYIPGPEYGVFLSLDPQTGRAEILSLTDKRLTAVTGDGTSTLEQLILADERTVALAPVFLRRFADHRQLVLAAGERQNLVEIGTHAAGALFLDATLSATPALTEVLGDVLRGTPGFFFGRFDLKAPSPEDLLAGRRLQILEFNGLSSEATHIYQPGASFIQAIRVFCRQWRTAFAFGSVHRADGLPSPSLTEVLKTLRRYRRAIRSTENGNGGYPSSASVDASYVAVVSAPSPREGR